MSCEHVARWCAHSCIFVIVDVAYVVVVYVIVIHAAATFTAFAYDSPTYLCRMKIITLE